MSLTWSAQAGEHNWRIEVWEGGKLEASRSGGITVSGTPNGSFNVVLTAYPTELEGGGTVYFTVKAWNYGRSLIPVKGFIEVDGNVIKNIKAEIPANANGDSMLTLSYDLIGVGNHSIKLFLDNQDGEPNGKGDEHWSEVKVTVKPPSVQTAFMKCSDLVLSAERGNLVLDMSCEVHFTNPTDIEWEITDVVTEARILKSQYTQEITPEFSDSLLTPIVPAKEIGRVQVNFHDTLSESGFLGKSVKIGELAGVSVPVEVNLTLEVNGKTYVADSQGNIWSLKYKAIKIVKIRINTDNVKRDLVGELALGLAGAVAGTIAGAKIGAALGSAVPGAGTVAGAIVGGIVGFIGGLLLYEKLGWP